MAPVGILVDNEFSLLDGDDGTIAKRKDFAWGDTCDDNDDDDGIPVVRLSLENSIHELNASWIVEQHKAFHQAVAEADPTTTAKDGSLIPSTITVTKVDCVATHEPHIKTVDCCSMKNASGVVATHSSTTTTPRAAFISATVIKEHKNTVLGMGLKKLEDGSLQVSSMKPDCLLSNTPIRVGHKLVSINNIPQQKSLSKAGKLLQNTTGMLTIVVEDPHGDPKLVESMIRKATPTSKTGLGVATGNACVVVSSIHPGSPFSQSLLSPRDQILSVNGIDCTRGDATEAATIIQNETTAVTIVAKKGLDNAAVVTFCTSTTIAVAASE